ncbi:MAG: hypothetical protein MN733_23365 [Nitrososphaera sp.]|nr:hypothetical protein [Nitrososphaera sp.]
MKNRSNQLGRTYAEIKGYLEQPADVDIPQSKIKAWKRDISQAILDRPRIRLFRLFLRLLLKLFGLPTDPHEDVVVGLVAGTSLSREGGHTPALTLAENASDAEPDLSRVPSKTILPNLRRARPA